jgi:hypothetical protein
MRRALAITLVLLTSLLPLSAAAQTPATGTVTGTATDAGGKTMANVTVRVRNLLTGELTSSTTSNAIGEFSFVGLNPATYAVEVVDAAGAVIGTSSSITLAAGATVTVTVGASAAAAAAAVAAGGATFFASTAGIVTVAAAGAAVAGVTVASNQGTESPSK